MEGQFMFKISLLWDLYVCLSILNIYTIMMLGMCTQHWPFSYSSSSTPTILDREDIIVENNLFEIFCLNFMKCVKHMWQIPHDPKTRMSKRKKAAQFYSLRVWKGKKIMKLQKDFLSAQRFIIFLLLFRTIVHSLTHSLSPSYLELPLSCN